MKTYKVIYIVMGTTGEWSDRTEWVVAAFSTEDKAKEHLGLLQKTYLSFDQNERGYQREDKVRDALDAAMTPLDPNFYEDYTGTRWFITQVEWKG